MSDVISYYTNITHHIISLPYTLLCHTISHHIKPYRIVTFKPYRNLSIADIILNIERYRIVSCYIVSYIISFSIELYLSQYIVLHCIILYRIFSRTLKHFKNSLDLHRTVHHNSIAVNISLKQTIHKKTAYLLFTPDVFKTAFYCS